MNPISDSNCDYASASPLPYVYYDPMDKFKYLLDKYSISREFAIRLRELDGLKLLLL